MVTYFGTIVLFFSVLWIVGVKHAALCIVTKKLRGFWEVRHL